MYLPLLTVLLLAPADPASASTPSVAEEPDLDTLATQAQEAFDAGDYARVVEVARRAYARSGSLAFLYAQAHAERFRGNCKEALGLYGRVLAADPTGPYAVVAQEGIELCTSQPAPEPKPEPVPEPEPAPPPAPMPAESVDRDRPDALGIAWVSVGAVSAAASVALFVGGGLAIEQADTADDERAFADDRVRARRLMIGGGVAAGAAVVFSTLGAVRLSRVRREQVQVQVSGDYVGLSLRSRF